MRADTPTPRRTFATLAILALTISAMTLLAQQPTFRSTGVVVPVFVTVTDKDQRLVTDLVEADFEVLDNDKPQPLTVFDNRYRPISIVVLLDTSISMTGNLAFLRDAAEQFVIRLFPQDKAKVGEFHDRIVITPQFTSDRDALARQIRNLDFGNSTRLYDALGAGLDALKGAGDRRVILVFTDGEDSGSSIGSSDVLDRARAEEAMVYVIGLISEYFNGAQRVRTTPDRGLRRIAEETGGGYFILERTSDLGATFTRVAQELHSQYVMGFSPSALDGKIHRVSVKVKRPGMTARARRSYLAEAKSGKEN